MTRFLMVLCMVLVGCDEPDVVKCISSDEYTDPVESCIDFNPCTLDIYSDKYGCHYEQLPSGVSCFSGSQVGQCQYGLCVIKKDDWSDAVCVEGANGCFGDEPYVVKQLDGACYVEWCNFDKPGRSLQPKPAGSPCVRPLNEGVPEFVVSQCGPCGSCL